MSTSTDEIMSEAEIKQFVSEIGKQGITATLGQLTQSVNQPHPTIPGAAIQGALDVLCGQPMPARVSFQLGKIVKAVNGELEQYHATRKTLCERYANKDEKGNAITLNSEGEPTKEGEAGKYDIPPDTMEAFNKELADLLSTEVTIPGEQVKIDQLSNVTIAPAHLMQLSWLISDET